MKAEIVKKLMLSGLSIITNDIDEQNESSAKLTKLWDDYETKGVYGKTFNKYLHSALYCIYSEYENEEKGNYTATVAIEVTKAKNAMIIENGRYLVFKNKGELPGIVKQTWVEIKEYFEENSEFTRKFSVDFERYLNEDEVEIFISIK